MCGRLLSRLFCMALAVLVGACGGGGGDAPGDGACATPECDLAFETGIAETVLSVTRGDPVGGRAACLAQARSVATTEGVRLQLADGTCFGTPDDTPVLDDFGIGVDDGGGPRAQQVEQAFDGVVRVWAGSRDAPETVAFDPPAMLEVELYGNRRGGAWASYLILDENGFAAGPPTDPSGGTRTAVFLGAVPPVANGPETVALPRTGIVGFVYVPEVAAEASPSAVSPAGHAALTTVSARLPEAAFGEFPNICTWQVVLPDTGQIVMVGFPSASMSPGDTHTASLDGRSYTAELTTDGQLRLSSVFHNRVSLLVALCVDISLGGVEVTLQAEGGSEREEDRSGPYDGAVSVLLGGTNRDEMVSLIARFPRMVNAPARARVVQARSWNGGFELRALVFSHSESHRELVRQFPSDWRYEFANRALIGNVDAPLGEPQLRLTVDASQSNLCSTTTCFATAEQRGAEGPFAERATFNCSDAAAVLDYGLVTVDASSACLPGGGSASAAGTWTDHVVVEPGDPALDGSAATLGVRLAAIGAAVTVMCRNNLALTSHYWGSVRIGGETISFIYQYPNTTVELPTIVEAPIVLGRSFELFVQFVGIATAVDCNDGTLQAGGSQSARLSWQGIDSVIANGVQITDFFVRSASGTDWKLSWDAQ